MDYRDEARIKKDSRVKKLCAPWIQCCAHKHTRSFFLGGEGGGLNPGYVFSVKKYTELIIIVIYYVFFKDVPSKSLAVF